MEPYVNEDYPHLQNVLSHLNHVRKSSRGWIACCPAHNDRHPSLSIALGKEDKVLLNCHAGCPIENVLETVGLTMSDLFPTSSLSTSKRQPRPGITLLDFSQDKMLHWRFLINQGIVEEPGRGLRIPYYKEDGTLALRHRIRSSLVAKEGSWWTKDPGEIIPYGLEQLEKAREEEYLILVEGETDRLTLLYHGYHALGIPGSEMVKTTLASSYLRGITKLYIMQEPDKAGQQFVDAIAELLQSWDWNGAASVVTLPDAKDPNELHKRDWKAFKTVFQQALDHALPLFQPSVPETTPVPLSEQDLTAPFSLQQLLQSPFSPLHWIVPNLISEGLLLLVGKPKQGKSWFALQLAIAVASGGTLFGSYTANQSDVLYLALEDTPQRLQARAKQLLATMETMPTRLEFAVQHTRLDPAGLAELEAYTQAHPKLGLVIIDTWAKLAPMTPPRARTQYEMDYAALAPLKQLADTHHLSMLVIHHLRKSSGQDILDQITGSTGLTGAMDEILLLKRERERDEATLFITGRDIQEQMLSLTFHTTTAQWTLAETESETHEREEA
ncbi:AAA family ATPase [Dictyobacter arantiisoli]|uniref:Toprim domain-containing protein n=1 Tax=Dictyobacter arantiisoli TaxID=2014874 RepID=A0A5A5TJM3_9CHLR|nr:AAA family ATPase [Dictyobacter arantiisoli]GCF11811.1 hypothetical protein KDI_53750 [Dictyobacter arantiisoli]